MEEQKYYLVHENTFFYDPHGTPDNGGSRTFVSKEKFYKDLKPGVCYEDDGNVFNDEENEYYAEDGYNCEVTTFTFQIITEEQYKEYDKIINDYNKL